MSAVFRRIAGDFFSTILFVVVWIATDNVLAATVVAVVAAIAQFAWAKRAGYEMGVISYASLVLVVLLGGATLATGNSRFVLVKPSLAHFGIGAIMLKRGWMARYMPSRVMDVAPDLPVAAGYWWAALMIAVGVGVVATALTGDLKLWGLFVFGVAPAAKVVAFLIQYAVFRMVIARRIAAGVRAGKPSPLS